MVIPRNPLEQPPAQSEQLDIMPTDSYLNPDFRTERLTQPQEMLPPPLEAAPLTSEDITSRWGALQGRWQKFKGAVSGVVGRLRATLNGEEYDAGKHNRTVQNALYSHLGKAPVRQYLANNDPRYNDYANQKLSFTDKTREAAIGVALSPLLLASVGVVAFRGFFNMAVRKAEAGSPLAHLANEGAEARQRKQEERAEKDAIRTADAYVRPRTGYHRRAAVGWAELIAKPPRLPR